MLLCLAHHEQFSERETAGVDGEDAGASPDEFMSRALAPLGVASRVPGSPAFGVHRVDRRRLQHPEFAHRLGQDLPASTQEKTDRLLQRRRGRIFNRVARHRAPKVDIADVLLIRIRLTDSVDHIAEQDGISQSTDRSICRPPLPAGSLEPDPAPV